MTNPQDRIRNRFDLLDTDHNGYLERQDFEALAARLIDAFDGRTSPDKTQAVEDGHRSYWQGLLEGMDADHDGRVSLEEYTSHVHSTEWTEAHLRDYTESVAAIADVNDDGYIEKSDFLTCMTAVGFSDQSASALFDELDTDHDTRITTGEWTSAINAYYTSDSEAVPGRQLTPGRS